MEEQNTMIHTALAEGLLWSGLWMAYLYMIMKFFPWEMLHDYLEDVRKASTLPVPDKEQKRKARIISGIGSVIIFGALIVFGLLQFHAEKTGFMSLFCFLFIIAMSWNVIDLLVMDFLLACTLRPAWLIIPGTENCSSYGDYGYHFRGFLNGCIISVLIAIIFSGTDYVILYFLVW